MLIETREDAPNFPNQTPGVGSPGYDDDDDDDDDDVIIMFAGIKMRTPKSYHCHYWCMRVWLISCWNPTNINTAKKFWDATDPWVEGSRHDETSKLPKS